MVRKESATNADEEMLKGSEAETYRSVVGILMYFKRHRFDLHYAAKSLAMASSSPTKGHRRRSESEFCATFKERETCIWDWFGPENS